MRTVCFLQLFGVKNKIRITIHYFVIIMSTFPCCAYMFSVVIMIECSRQITVLYMYITYIYNI